MGCTASSIDVVREEESPRRTSGNMFKVAAAATDDRSTTGTSKQKSTTIHSSDSGYTDTSSSASSSPPDTNDVDGGVVTCLPDDDVIARKSRDPGEHVISENRDEKHSRHYPAIESPSEGHDGETRITAKDMQLTDERNARNILKPLSPRGRRSVHFDIGEDDDPLSVVPRSFRQVLITNKASGFKRPPNR